MNEFLYFIDEKRRDFPMHIDIYYSKTMDWCITIYKRGCAEDYPNAKYDGNDVVICNVQSNDIEVCFAKAYVAVTEWFIEFEGGY